MRGDTAKLALSESEHRMGGHHMTDENEWREVWDTKSRSEVPDFDLDRGTSPRDKEIEHLSGVELLNFIRPGKSERILDAGCGTGVNILRLHSQVQSIVGIDYARGSVERCRKRVQGARASNVSLMVGSISEVPLETSSIDKILCLSVLQYMDDEEVRRTIREFARLLRPEGDLILHVKNRSSLYWSTLLVAKKILASLGLRKALYNVRPWRWYMDTLREGGFRIVDFNSCNLAILDGMPKMLVSLLQEWEIRHHDGWLLQNPLSRRHGADLKIKARNGGAGASKRFAERGEALDEIDYGVTVSTGASRGRRGTT
jgi:SAM-dependent methyltransferase